MKLLLILLSGIVFIPFSVIGKTKNFAADQIRYPRVRTAHKEKMKNIKKMFEEKNVEYPTMNIFLRIFKNEKILELWSKSDNADTYVLIKEYKMTNSSGILGPKRREGDCQIPEGFYSVDRFNPASSFYLSLGLNYPNRSDRKLGDPKEPGSDIFIHGSSATIGCIPIGNSSIKELYIIAVDAKSHGQKKIPVHIFPCKMDLKNYTEILNPIIENKTELKQFWNNIKIGYDYFVANKKLINYTIDNSGKYKFDF